MLATDPIHCQKGFVTPYKLFYANYKRCIGSILHQKSFVTHWSSSLLIVWLYCPNSLLKSLCHTNLSSFLLIACLYWPNSSSKNPCYQNLSLFLLITCPLLAAFSVEKALLSNTCPCLLITSLRPGKILLQKSFNSHMSSFLLITCTSIAYQKDFLTEYELFSANNMLLFGLVHS